jgi:hypothetical protein
MTSQESSSSSQGQQYLSKKVMINGQFVTLYSLNGLTWLSSPEDLQNTMERLDSSRVTFNDQKGDKAEKDSKDAKEARDGKGDKGDKGEKQPAQMPKLASSQYRMKGPKPRPILRQGGKVVEGPPIEPPSAAAVNMKTGLEALPQIKLTPAEKGPRRGKLVAPLAQRRPGQVKPPKAAPPAKVQGGKGAVAAKGKAVPPVAPVSVKGGKKVAAPVAAKPKKVAQAPVKVTKAPPVAKKVAKPQKVAKKAVTKPAKVKKAAPKPAAKKRSKR